MPCVASSLPGMTNAHEVVAAYWAAAQARDWDTVAGLVAERIVGEGHHAASWLEFSDAGDRYPGVCFFDLNEEGQIARITDFWPAPAELPDSRAHLVERY